MKKLFLILILALPLAGHAQDQTLVSRRYVLRPESKWNYAGTDGKHLGAYMPVIIAAEKCARYNDCTDYKRLRNAPYPPSNLRVIR